jgi:RNA polymerase sigma-70 factor (ECF subfamily)
MEEQQRAHADRFDAIAPALLLFARQWTDTHGDAEDVVQDTLMRFLKEGRRDVRVPKAYLFACVKRAALDLRRGRARRARREAEAQRRRSAGAMAHVSLFESPLERDEWRAAVESALARLPGPQREVLVLKIWGDLTFPEIGEALGISPNTAASRHRYALESLRSLLAKEVTP